MAEPVMLPGGNRVEVVGESHYDQNLETVTGGRTEDGHDFDCVAHLIPEPDNPYDSNAVAIHIDDLKVGHLSRQAAAAYQPIARRLSGHPATCCATVRGGWDRGKGNRGNFGIILDLAGTDTCLRIIDNAGVPAPQQRRGWLVRLFKV